MIYKTWTEADNDGALWCLPVYELNETEREDGLKAFYITDKNEALKEFDKIKHGILWVLDLEYGEAIDKQIIKAK